MRINGRLTKPFLAAATCASIVLALQACRTLPPHGSGAPYLISFEFDQDVNVSPAEKARFLAALERYTVPGATKIKVGEEVIWPPQLSEIKTEKLTVGEEHGSAKGASASGPSGTQNVAGHLHAAQNAEAVSQTQSTMATRITQAHSKGDRTSHTQTPTRQLQLLCKTRSTQYLGFQSEADMRAFFSAVSR